MAHHLSDQKVFRLALDRVLRPITVKHGLRRLKSSRALQPPNLGRREIRTIPAMKLAIGKLLKNSNRGLRGSSGCIFQAS